MKTCKYCMLNFEPKSKKAEFCSNKCRVYWGRGKDGEIVKTNNKEIIEVLRQPPNFINYKEQLDKIINPNDPKNKQMKIPPKGSNAYFLRFGKWD